ncbi:unnamed protein product, partial [marine sediment metagenome]
MDGGSVIPDIRCSSCGTKLPADSDFCDRCGAPLRGLGEEAAQRRGRLVRLGLALAAPVMAAGGVVLALWVAGIIPPSPSEPSVPELTESVVQIVAQDSDGSLVWAGCGTIISADGLVLTAAHVIDDRQAEYETLQVGVVSEPDRPPEPRYIAEVTAVDYTLDLAVIRIVSDLDGIPVEVDLPYVSIGDSDAMEIGDHVRILGFPEIGGQTV